MTTRVRLSKAVNAQGECLATCPLLKSIEVSYCLLACENALQLMPSNSNAIV